MVSGICFKTHSRCIRALLVQLTRNFNKNQGVLGGSAQVLAGVGGRLSSCRDSGPKLDMWFTSVKRLDLPTEPCVMGSRPGTIVLLPGREERLE